MNNKSLALSLLFLCIPFIAKAECSGYRCTDVKISRMYVQADGNTLIGTSGTEDNLDCKALSDVYITLGISNKNYNATYSLLLAAHTTNQTVQIRTTSSGDCKIVYVVSDQ